MDKNQINILFLGGAKRVSLAERFIKAGETLGKKVNIFSYELDKFVPIASIGEVIVGLRWNDQNIVKDLSEVIKKYGINIVLPSVDPAIVITARVKEANPEVFVAISNPLVCNLFFDKIKANDWFKQFGLPVPHNIEKLPLIAKPKAGSASKGLEILRNQAELHSFKSCHQLDDYLLQEFIDGTEYTVDAYISQKGDIKAVVPRERVEVNSGEVVKSKTVDDSQMIEMTKKIIGLSELTGPINIQYIEDKSGKLYIMEINPRFGGGVILSIEAGANLPLMLLREYLGEENPPYVNWERNLLMIRSYKETFYANCN